MTSSPSPKKRPKTADSSSTDPSRRPLRKKTTAKRKSVKKSDQNVELTSAQPDKKSSQLDNPNARNGDYPCITPNGVTSQGPSTDRSSIDQNNHLNTISIHGAREHNLQDVRLTLPREQLICLTGVSGSGKSSLAFDTLYAEGQRRYIESLSGFARQFIGQMPKPDVDAIDGLSPAISIAQKTAGSNPRSTVGTITEIHDYLRVLYARTGVGYCPQCGRRITSQTRQQIVDRIEQLPNEGVTSILVLAPLIRGQKGAFADLFRNLLKQGFVRARLDGEIIRLDDASLQLDRQMRHFVDVVIDRITLSAANHSRLASAVELALKLGNENMFITFDEPPKKEIPQSSELEKRNDEKHTDDDADDDTNDDENVNVNAELEAMETSGLAHLQRIVATSTKATKELTFSASYACTHCDLSFEPPSPQMFSFNSPQGMCPKCAGLGEVYGFDLERLIPDTSRSFQQGALELIGNWKDMGRWKRHIFRGVAEYIEKKYELASGTLLETAWEEVPEAARHELLWGTGNAHITYTWRGGTSGYKWGGTFAGILPEMLEQYRTTKSAMQRRAFEKYMSVVTCGECHGERLNAQARSIRLRTASQDFGEDERAREKTLPEVSHLTITEAIRFFQSLDQNAAERRIAEEALKEIRGRLGFLQDVGLEYLTLDRTAPTLSGGEMQRIRLASQIGCGLTGVLYVLDEPSIGLHPRDNTRLIRTLRTLRDQGNTVVVVEHDEDTMRASDWIVDFGPGPGIRGGHVVAEGPLEEILDASESQTGDFLAGRRTIATPEHRRPVVMDGGKTDATQELNVPESNVSESTIPTPLLTIFGAKHNNLKNIDVRIPLGRFVCVTGVSGSGKSSLVTDILTEVLNRELNHGLGQPGAYDRIEGLNALDKMISIDQSPIGRTPRSNPATYIKLMDEIRTLYAQLPESKMRGYAPGRFSFNVTGGRCEACEGNGATKLEMDFLADIWVPCPVCEGKRFNHETLQVLFKEKSIADVLAMDVQEAMEHFANVPTVFHKLETLHDVGLDYIQLGQPSPTLSGGEAQRVKLARELAKIQTGRTFYILDEPTTGLHFADVEMLLKVLHRLVDAGNTVLVVEHNLEVVKTADWVIDLGPEGGVGGGQILVEGTPERIAKCEQSYTGRALREFLDHEQKLKAEYAESLAHPERKLKKNTAVVAACSEHCGCRHEPKAIIVQGACQHNLKGVNLTIPGEQMTVCCGPSGSGKSSLAMDTIYAEGQRRYVESLSAYARQFVGQMEKPKLDHIEGLSPAIAIEQKHASNTPRSTVGTVTEIHDYLRILLSRLGTQYCPECSVPAGTQTSDEITSKIVAMPEGAKIYITAPLEVEVGQTYETLWDDLRNRGYQRVRIDGETYTLETPPKMDRKRRHDVEVIVDRAIVRLDARGRIAESVESALSLGRGVLRVVTQDESRSEKLWQSETQSVHFVCPQCGRSFQHLAPQNFSFNSPLGWCPACEGLGIQTGATSDVFLENPHLSLLEGAIRLFPNSDSPLQRPMLEAFSRETGVPLNVPYEQLAARYRRILLYGTGETWFEVFRPSESSPPESVNKNTSESERSNTEVWFKFQYRGIYPSLDEATKLSREIRDAMSSSVGEVECTVCSGSRLTPEASAVQFAEHTIDDLSRMPLRKLSEVVATWQLTESQQKIAGELLREIRNRLEFLIDVGLDYLTLGRSAPTLSGGESQRIRLASQIGSGLVGVLYVLDEPTIGLHPRDNARLITALKKLKDLGNTLLLVEHDREVLEAADRLIDFGPRSGSLGGEVVAEGSPQEIKRIATSVTGPYLSGEKKIPIPQTRRMPSIHTLVPQNQDRTAASGKASSGKAFSEVLSGKTSSGKTLSNIYETIPTPGGGWITVEGAAQNNLKNVDISIPLGTLSVVTGVSGSGKSSFVEDILYNALARRINRANTVPGTFRTMHGIEQINKVIRVDQQPIGQMPTSNPATFTGVFDLIRNLYAQLPDARLRGFTARRFSFNVPGGRCEKCEGNGRMKIEMHFLPDVWVECDACGGKRYDAETLSVKFCGKSIADVLEMSCGDALTLFENIPSIRRILQTLCDVGLEYLTLGHPAPSLSGGEAQRVKLAAELARPDTGKTLYLLDEPTTGLHFTDLEKLLEVLNRLVGLGNTVVVIEHNLDLIKTADWIVELGPEAGYDGGYLVAEGTPEDLIAHARYERSLNGSTSSVSSVDMVSSDTQSTSEALPTEATAIEPVTETLPTETASGVRKASRKRVKKATEVNRKSRSKALENSEQTVSQTVSAELSATCSADPTALCLAVTGNESLASALPKRSYTGEALIPVFEEGVFVAPVDYENESNRENNTLTESESEVSVESLIAEEIPEELSLMPWESDGRTWHTQTRLSRNGSPCQWDGRILAEVVDRIEATDFFSPVDWNQKTTVEIRSEKKSEGWFFHAITGEEWLLKLKFRVAKNFFTKDLVTELGLPSLNDTPEIPLYGNEPRTRIQTAGVWQEIELRLCSYEEFNRPEIWNFLDRAIEGFRKICEHQRQNPNDLSPWKQLGEKWHRNPRGFPLGRRCVWDHEALDRLIELITSLCPEGRWVWTNKVTVPIYLGEQENPWAYIHTKRPEALYLVLVGRKGAFPRGRLTTLPGIPELDDTKPNFDRIRFTFMETSDLNKREFRLFLEEHLAEALRTP